MMDWTSRSWPGSWSVSVAVCGALLGAAGERPVAAQASNAAISYPPTARGTQGDELNGLRVADPYRWLESGSSPEVRAWVTAQNVTTEAYLAGIPERSAVRDLVYQAWNIPRFSVPFSAGERLFYYENDGLENQSSLHVKDRRDTPPRELLDPNAFAREGVFAVVDQAPSPDGRYLAYAASAQGSAWRVVRVRDVRTGQDRSDELTGIKTGPLAWTRDERGFFYVRSDAGHRPASANPLAPDGRQQLLYHRVGRPQSSDELVYENPRSARSRLSATVSDDGQYVVIADREGVADENRMVFIDLDNPRRPNLGAPLVRLFDAGDALYEFVANVGPVFYIRTTKNAPRARLVAVDINAPDENHWTTIVRESFDPLVAARRVDDRFVAHRLHDAHSVLELYALDGGARGTIALPGVGTVTEINARSGFRELYFGYSSYLQPLTVFRYDLDTRTTSAFRETRGDSTLAAFETTQLYYASRDGTRVPMFVTARRGLTLDGSHPTLLTGMGSLGVSSTPAYSPAVRAWLALGGIYAVANVRGGGEYGRAWHEAATGAQKTVAIDDFSAAAEFLINQRYTRASRLGATGTGLGGMLAAATVVRHPELFGAAVLDASALDLARFDRAGSGPAWTVELGSPANRTDLTALLAYSPLHGLRPDEHYPPVLLTVGDHDEVVGPAPSYKFAAALQALGDNAAPALLRVEYDSGFGPGVATAKQIATETDQLTFLLHALRGAR